MAQCRVNCPERSKLRYSRPDQFSGQNNRGNHGAPIGGVRLMSPGAGRYPAPGGLSYRSSGGGLDAASLLVRFGAFGFARIRALAVLTAVAFPGGAGFGAFAGIRGALAVCAAGTVRITLAFFHRACFGAFTVCAAGAVGTALARGIGRRGGSQHAEHQTQQKRCHQQLFLRRHGFFPHGKGLRSLNAPGRIRTGERDRSVTRIRWIRYWRVSAEESAMCDEGWYACPGNRRRDYRGGAHGGQGFNIGREHGGEVAAPCRRGHRGHHDGTGHGRVTGAGTGIGTRRKGILNGMACLNHRQGRIVTTGLGRVRWRVRGTTGTTIVRVVRPNCGHNGIARTRTHPVEGGSLHAQGRYRHYAHQIHCHSPVIIAQSSQNAS